jgi:two-component system, chemotaxis family, sensor kinase Cph1
VPTSHSPAFGQADLTNCERELIHLAASVQPHGLMLVIDEARQCVVQASANTAELLGTEVSVLLGQPVSSLGGDIAARLADLAAQAPLDNPAPVQCTVGAPGALRTLEGCVHRLSARALVVELEPIEPALHAESVEPGACSMPTVALSATDLREHLTRAVERFSAAPTLGALADAAVTAYRNLTGYDRLMVYQFDPDGHGKIIAEARDPRLDSLLGHHYPATDIPQRARQLYIRNRVRVLADVHYVASPLVPRLLPLTGEDTDMSMCALRSMSPLHTQYLKNMGVTATLVVSLVHEGKLWGLVAAHHYSPRNLRYPVRAAADLMAEVMVTRIAAIENYAHAQVAIQVRRLEQRLIEATSTEGDWRHALLRNPRTLLQPLQATGAALFHDNEVLTTGDVPSTPELRSLLAWVNARPDEAPFHCASIGKAAPHLASLTPTASGVLAMRLSRSRPDFLMWFRKEQLSTVTWGGDPNKAVVGNDPLDLSPRRSFAAWSEIVRGTALPWSASDLALGKAMGLALADIIVQVHAVRLLIAEHQLGQIRDTIQNAHEPVVIAGANGRLLFSNGAFVQLAGPASAECESLQDVAALFTDPGGVRDMLAALRTAHQPWRGELAFERGLGASLPVSLRAEVVPGAGGAVIGFILILADLSDNKRAEAARQHLEQSLEQAAVRTLDATAGAAGALYADPVLSAIFTNASLAAMDIADSGTGPTVAPLLEQLELSAQRAAALYGQIRAYADNGTTPAPGIGPASTAAGS